MEGVRRIPVLRQDIRVACVRVGAVEEMHLVTVRPGANGSVIPIPLAQRRRPLATGKEDRARPILFPVASGSGRRYTGARTTRPGEVFGANVDSLHILHGRPWGPSRKMFRSHDRCPPLDLFCVP